MVRFALTNATPYLALTGELCGVFCELYEEKWPRYIESPLYIWIYTRKHFFLYIHPAAVSNSRLVCSASNHQSNSSYLRCGCTQMSMGSWYYLPNLQTQDTTHDICTITIRAIDWSLWHELTFSLIIIMIFFIFCLSDTYPSWPLYSKLTILDKDKSGQRSRWEIFTDISEHFQISIFKSIFKHKMKMLMENHTTNDTGGHFLGMTGS